MFVVAAHAIIRDKVMSKQAFSNFAVPRSCSLSSSKPSLMNVFLYFIIYLRRDPRQGRVDFDNASHPRRSREGKKGMAIGQRHNRGLFSLVVGQSTSPDKPLKQGHNPAVCASVCILVTYNSAFSNSPRISLTSLIPLKPLLPDLPSRQGKC